MIHPIAIHGRCFYDGLMEEPGELQYGLPYSRVQVDDRTRHVPLAVSIHSQVWMLLHPHLRVDELISYVVDRFR